MKRQERELLVIVKSGLRGVLEDALAHLTPLVGSTSAKRNFERDFSRVVLSLNNRGRGFVTHDLPELEASLLRGLETGVLPTTHGFKTMRRAKVPVFAQGLWLRIFNETGELLDQPDETAMVCLRTICQLGKKLLVECSKKYKEQCYDNYVTIDDSLREPSRWWRDLNVPVPISGDGNIVHVLDCLDDPLPLFEDRVLLGNEPPRGLAYLLANFQRFADDFVGGLPEYAPASFIWWERKAGRTGGKHGKGAVASGPAQTDKYADRHWGPLIRSFFEYEDFRNDKVFGRDLPSVDHLLPSRVIGVHKDAKKIRIIACEPSNNQWLQQLTLSFMKKHVLTRTKGQVQLDRQDLSRQAAKAGSLDRETGTIDLSDASDRLSLWLVERAFRRNYSLLAALRAHRTPYAEIPSRGSVRLRKFASQGSAVTFPVQSLVFWMLCQSVATNGDITRLGKTARSRSIRVYGDDIVCHSSDYRDVQHLLEAFQLKVNTAKSYIDSYFRESCGGDYWRGQDVTPIRLRNVFKRNDPASMQALLDVSNNAHKAGLWHLAARLYENLPKRMTQNLPFQRVCNEESQGGYKQDYPSATVAFVPSENTHLTSRWSEDLQRPEYRVWSLKTVQERRDRCWESRTLQGIYEMPYLSEGFTTDILERPKLREQLVWDMAR